MKIWSSMVSGGFPFPVTSPTSCMQLVPFQLLPWWWIPEWVGLRTFEVHAGPLSRLSWKSSSFLLLPQPPLVFIVISYGDLSSRCCNLRLCGLACGWDCLLPKYLSWFLSTTHECGTALSAAATAASLLVSMTPPHLLIWVNVASLNSWLSDFHTALFSHGSGWYLFWDLVVILSLVTQGGEVFLRFHLNWKSARSIFKVSILLLVSQNSWTFYSY